MSTKYLSKTYYVANLSLYQANAIGISRETTIHKKKPIKSAIAYSKIRVIQTPPRKGK